MNIYEYLSNNDSSKQLILEPLTCVLKLALLQWKPKGTKVSVLNNSLKFHIPTMYQGIMRKINGDSRNDLHNIYHPISKCLEWYSRDNPIYVFFYNESIKGLNTLKTSYESNSLINHTINHYIAMLDASTEYEKIEDTSVVSGLRNMWCEKEISILKTIIEHIMDVSDDIDKKIYIDMLEHMLVSKEDKVHFYIQQIASSYQAD